MNKKRDFSKNKKIPEKAEYKKLSETVKELDRIAKMLVRRDLELSETREKLEISLEELQKKNLAYEEKVRQLEAINRVMVGREIKMIELKNELSRLNAIIGNQKYKNNGQHE